MKILVVGGGGREHALVWKIAQSRLADEIIAAPGNAGIAQLATTYPVAADDIDGLRSLAIEREVDLTVVGPEIPLTLGLTDRLTREGFAVFGPTQAAARLEGSKWFAKELMLRLGVPTARAWLCRDAEEACGRAREIGYPAVIKADGLAAGKGVVVARSESEAAAAIDDALVRNRFGASGEAVLVEEYLDGEEVSVRAFSDGRRLAYLVPSQDHKRALDGDRGPNTGGMGAYAPVPAISDDTMDVIESRIAQPIVDGMAEDGCTYRGVLYIGLMLTEQGPKVVEINCRFGDPEAQAALPLLDCDIVEVMLACAHGELDPGTVTSGDGAAGCVVMTSGGYPGAYDKGKIISGVERADSAGSVVVFHAGTSLRGNDLVTSGGRVLGVTGLASDLPTALDRAYRAVGEIAFEGAAWRKDIGWRALNRLRAQEKLPQGS